MIIADTGFWLALANAKDKHHKRAKACLLGIDETLICTWPVVTETCYLLLDRLGAPSQEAFMESLAGGAFELFPLTSVDGARLAALMKRYRGWPMDLADASLVLLAEHLGHGRILSTDRRDFDAYRWKTRQPFQNLLLQ